MAESKRYELTKDDPIFKEGTQAFVPVSRPPSGPRTISRAEIDRVNAKMGWTPAPPNHPVYSEGPSITFSSRTPKSPESKQSVQLLHLSRPGSGGTVEWSADLERHPDGQVYMTMTATPAMYEGEEVDTPAPVLVRYADEFFNRLRGNWFEFARGGDISDERWWQVYDKVRNFMPSGSVPYDLYEHLRAEFGEPPPKKYGTPITLKITDEQVALWEKMEADFMESAGAPGTTVVAVTSPDGNGLSVPRAMDKRRRGKPGRV